MRIKCLICLKEFNASPSRTKIGKGKFCSKKCWYKQLSINNKGKNNFHWKEKEKINCKYCGRELFVIPSYFLKGRGCFCTKVCFAKYLKKYYKGENAPFWKGGITPQIRLIRNSKEMTIWKMAIFKRDNYICQNCGAQNGMGQSIVLHAHHIKSFSLFPLLRFNLENGITLCNVCHYLLHKSKDCKTVEQALNWRNQSEDIPVVLT